MKQAARQTQDIWNLLTSAYFLGLVCHPSRIFCIICNSPKLLFANHLSQVLDDKLSRAKCLLGADAPALALSSESLQTLDPLMSLDVLVVTLLGTRTGAWRALCKTHPGDMGNKKKKVEWGWDNIPWQTYNQMLWFIFTYSGNHPGSLSQSTPHEVYSCMSLLHNQKEASRPHRHLWQTDRGDYHLYLQLVVHCHVKCEQ